MVSSRNLVLGDTILVEAGDLVPADGEVIEGVASVDEFAITGESAPVIRESGGDRSAVTCGTRVVSDWLRVRVTAKPGESFLDRMISLVEGAQRQKTPNEIALNILLVGMTIIFLIVVVTLKPFAIYSGAFVPVVFLVALLVTLIPTTIGGLLSAIGIAGMDRLVKANVIAKSGRAVEAAGDVDTLLLDKTGTITFGNRMADAFEPLPNVNRRELITAALLASLSDATPEGKSIVKLAEESSLDLATGVATSIAFSAHTRISGADLVDGSKVRKGCGRRIRCRQLGRQQPGSTSAKLIGEIRERAEALGATGDAPAPVDLVTASASGLDPDISPEAALFQVQRVAHARSLPEWSVRTLVINYVTGRTLGFLGESRVNVLSLNLALDRLAAAGG